MRSRLLFKRHLLLHFLRPPILEQALGVVQAKVEPAATDMTRATKADTTPALRRPDNHLLHHLKHQVQLKFLTKPVLRDKFFNTVVSY